LQHFLIEKIIIIAKGKVQKKEPHKKTREEQKAEGAKKRDASRKKIQKCLHLVSPYAELHHCLLELG